MKQASGNLWTIPADMRCITTNGAVKRDGQAVMGAGCAKEARDAIPGIASKLGASIVRHGNRVVRLTRVSGATLSSFPVKNHWRQIADPALIERSAHELVEIADKFGYENVVLPRPGCGNGRLKWEDVEPMLDYILDERFTAVTF